MVTVYYFSCKQLHKPNAALEETKQTKQKTTRIRQDDPYKVYEHLQLSLEEVCKLRQSCTVCIAIPANFHTLRMRLTPASLEQICLTYAGKFLIVDLQMGFMYLLSSRGSTMDLFSVHYIC